MLETRVCAYEECGREYTPTRHNQVYCSPDHLRLATNARIMERYHESKANRNGKARVCSTPGCGTLLSRYNDEKVCGKCLAEHEAAERKRMLDIFRNS